MHLLQVSIKSHVYSPRAGADNTWESKFLYQHKPFVTLFICWKFLPLNDFLTFFLVHVYTGIYNIFPYKSIRKQFDLIKKVMVNSRSSFEQSLLGPSPQCCIPSPKVIGPLVPENIFTIYGRGGHLGHVTQTPSPTNLRSLNPCRLHMKFGFDWPSGFGEEDVWKWWTTTDNEGRSLPIL